MKALFEYFQKYKIPVFGAVAGLAGLFCMMIVINVGAANVTVCNSGCDYTTITDAINGGGFSPGDTIFVGADYASTTETFPFNVPTGVNLDCQNSGAVIGTDDESNRVYINSQSDNIIQNCTFSNVGIQNTNQSNVQILNNIWRGSSTLDANTASNITFSGNSATGEKGIQHISVGNSSNIIITSNTIMSYAGNGTITALRIDSSTSIQVTSNIFQDNTTTTNLNYDVIDFLNHSFDIYFASNTVSEPYLVNFGGGMSVVQMQAENVRIEDNIFSLNGSGGGIGLNLNANNQNVSAIVRNNTYIAGATCNTCVLVQPGAFTSNTIYVTTTYNLFVSYASSSANNTAHNISGSGPSANLIAYSEYEGFSGHLNTANDPVNFPVGVSSTVRTYTSLKIDDATSTNNYEQTPWSAFLDVNGTRDMGARSGVRENTFQVDASGAIDYSAVDATNTTVIVSHLRSNDTVHLATGLYSPISLVATTTNVALQSGISILGAGPGTVIHASSTGDALSINGMTDSIFRDFTVTGASSTATSTYSITRAQFNAGGTDYDDGAGIGFPNAVIIAGAVPSGGSCNASLYDADGFNVTTLVGSATDDWNLFLIDYFGNKLTLLAPDRFVPDAVTALGCANPGDITVEHEVSSIYTVSSGSYTYNTAAAALAGVSPKAGETSPPRLDRVIIGATEAGVFLRNATGNTFTNVTSTANSSGVRFSGTAANNTIVNSAFTSNTRDISSDASTDNALRNTSFTMASAEVTGSGDVNVSFSARGYAMSSSNGTPVSGQSISLVSANSASSVTMTTDILGFTPYVSLPAMTLTSAGVSVTAGGFNPYQITAVANSFNGNTTSSNLAVPNRTFGFALISPSGGGGVDTGGGGLPASPGPGSSGSASMPDLFTSLGLAPGDLVKLPTDGNIITQEDSTVYELGADGKRHAFPNPSVFFSRHCDFSKVKTLLGTKLSQIPLGANMTYRPGLRLVKFLSVRTVYLVQTPNILRAIADETMARNLAGNTWNKQISDISDAFYLDYLIGAPITSISNLDLAPPTKCLQP